MNEKNLLLSDVAQRLRIKSYRIRYAIANGLVEEPAQRIGNQRVFTPQDVKRLAKHFGVALDEKKQ